MDISMRHGKILIAWCTHVFSNIANRFVIFHDVPKKGKRKERYERNGEIFLPSSRRICLERIKDPVWTHRRCGTPVRSRFAMRKRRTLRVGGSVARGSLAFPSGGWRRWMWQRSGRVPGMLGPLKLPPGLAWYVADVTAGNELRGTVQMRRRHYRRLLWLTTVSHFSSVLFVAVMSNQHTLAARSLGQHSVMPAVPDGCLHNFFVASLRIWDLILPWHVPFATFLRIFWPSSSISLTLQLPQTNRKVSNFPPCGLSKKRTTFLAKLTLLFTQK